MILMELKNYLRRVKTTTLDDLSRQFSVSKEMAEDMIQVWIRKGKIKKITPQMACASKCSSRCQRSSREVYEWLG